MKWVEINVGIGKDDSEAMIEALLSLADNLVTKFRSMTRDGCTWHYLWENVPWQLTLRLRFYCDEETLNRIKQEFEKLWSSLKALRPNIFVDYCYGCQGECGKEYYDEDDVYGSKGWELVKKILNFGSEIALELIMNVKIMEKSNWFKTSLDVYVDRYVHLFLNQVSPLINELDFYLLQLVYRYFLYATGSYPSKEVVDDVIKGIVQTLQ